MSSLEAISGFKLETDIVQNIIKDYTHLANTGKTIILCWIPSHVNIRGNERSGREGDTPCHTHPPWRRRRTRLRRLTLGTPFTKS